jgi:hypothetical protein
VAENKTTYVVRAIPIRDGGPDGDILGWIRVGALTELMQEHELADPDLVAYLRDGEWCTQRDLVEGGKIDRSLLFASKEEAVQDGTHRMRKRHAAGESTRLT